MTPVDPRHSSVSQEPSRHAEGDASASDNTMKMTRDLAHVYESQPEVSPSKRSPTPRPKLLATAEVPVGTFTTPRGGSASANDLEGASEGMMREIMTLRAERDKDLKRVQADRAQSESAFSGLTKAHTLLKSELAQMENADKLRFAQVKHASQQLQGAFTRIDELEGQIGEQSEQLNRAGASLASIQQEKAHIQNELSTSRATLDFTIEKCNQALSVSQAEGARYYRAYAGLEREYKAVSSNQARAQTEHGQELQRAHVELQRLTAAGELEMAAKDGLEVALRQAAASARASQPVLEERLAHTQMQV